MNNLKILYFILMLLFCSCSSNKTYVFYSNNEDKLELSSCIAEYYFYSDSTVALFRLEHDKTNNFSKISIHYPYFHRYSEDTLIITATNYYRKNDSLMLKSDSTFEIERFIVKRKKIVPEIVYHQTGYRINQSKSVIKKLLLTNQKTDSLDWRMYCYDCDTLKIDIPINFDLKEIGNKNVIEIYNFNLKIHK